MAKLPINFIIPLMDCIGLAKKVGDEFKPISKTEFGRLADYHKYVGGSFGRKGIYILYLGSKDNCFGFYPPQGNKKESLEMAYEYYLDCFTKMKQEFLDGNVCWGNCGIPLSYSELRVNEQQMNDLLIKNNEQPQFFMFHLGNIRISTYNINEIREVVNELSTKLRKDEEYSNPINQFIFDVETAYQQYYELDENDWSIIHNEKAGV